MKVSVLSFLLFVCMVFSLHAEADAVAEADSVHAFKVEDIKGEPVDLAAYKGQVLLIVNVASKCGLTRQYAALQALHEKYAEKGFAVLGFPANDFGEQEPGTNEEIALFCSGKYNVTFPMFSKVIVKGDEKVPLFRYLTTQETKPTGPGEIKWNFSKFLIGKDGKIIARYESRTEPNAEELIAALEAGLAQ